MTRAGLLVLAGALGLALPTLKALRSAQAARRELHPPRARVDDEHRAAARAALPRLREIALRTADGLTLRGWFSPGPKRDAVVLVHGWGGNRASLLPEAAILARRGHGVLLYDSRASGESEGDLVTWGDQERFDVRAAVAFAAAQPEVDPARVGIYGFSVGASAVAAVGATERSLAAVALGPTWTSLDDELADKFGSWGQITTWPARRAFLAAGIAVDAIRPIDEVGDIPPSRLFLMSGTADADTPPVVMARLHERAPTAERWLVPGAAHGEIAKVAPDELDRRFGGFFDRALAGGKEKGP